MIKHIGIITLYLTVLLLCSCENNISEIKAITDPKLVPIQSSFNCTYRYSLNGVVRTEVQAQQLDQYANDSTYLICPKPYVIQFYDSTGAYTGTMTGNEAIFSQKSNTFWTTGQLVLENYKHEKLETSALFFNIDDDIVFTKEPVKITTENSIIQGVGMRSNASFTEYEILQTSGDFNQK
ncbi:MAG: LPS export ABC transporter periplasmic protein LptC [Bacteroidetes bacterium]|nr:LPS export ABC transporter periplasmic protein LptC [Bacteroidota bacterium]